MAEVIGHGTDLLLLLGLIALGGLITRVIPDRFPLPRAMVGGILGLLLGPAIASLLPLAPERLEVLVYHGLGLVFITVGLQSPAPGEGGSADVRTIALAIPALTAIQGALGLAFVLIWGLGPGPSLHPGFGLLLPLGFGQGPGQALSLGDAWSAVGLADGGSLGLILAAVGFFWCAVVGTGWLGARGALRGAKEGRPEPESGSSEVAEVTARSPLAWAPVATNVLIVAALYAVTLGLLAGLTSLVGDRPQLRATMWGFHFIVGLLVALSCRALLGRSPPREGRRVPLDDAAQAVIAGVVVELTTAAALSAIRLDVLATWWLPVLLMTTIGGVATLAYCRWLERRVFQAEPFRHALLLFGTATGTLLTGMALLRVSDPYLRTPVASNQVRATPLTIPLMAPVLVGLMPWVVSLAGHDPTMAALAGLGVLVSYAGILTALLWRRRARSAPR